MARRAVESKIERAVAVALVMALATLTGCVRSSDKLAPILLFDGAGTSPGDVDAIIRILDREHLHYSTAGSWRLNRMSEQELRQFRLLILPGGNFVEMGNGLTPAAAANLREAVHDGGVNYLGICAGAFLAGNSPFNGLNLTSGVQFRFYSAEEQGTHKAAVTVTNADGQTLDQYWEDGPQLSGWGVASAKYSDGTPAVVQGRFGEGWVVLSGVHPEAEEAWRRGLEFKTPVEADQAFAARLIHAALNSEQLPHY